MTLLALWGTCTFLPFHVSLSRRLSPAKGGVIFASSSLHICFPINYFRAIYLIDGLPADNVMCDCSGNSVCIETSAWRFLIKRGFRSLTPYFWFGWYTDSFSAHRFLKHRQALWSIFFIFNLNWFFKYRLFSNWKIFIWFSILFVNVQSHLHFVPQKKTRTSSTEKYWIN